MPTRLETIRASGAFMSEEDESDIFRIFTEAITLSPDHWAACDLPVDLEWSFEKFEEASKAKIPENEGGVYTFVVQPGIANHPAVSYLFYVGKAEKSLRDRFQHYLFTKGDRKTKRFAIRRMLNYWDGYLWFYYATIAQQDQITDVEQKLQDSYLPHINREFRGEVGPAVRVLR